MPVSSPSGPRRRAPKLYGTASLYTRASRDSPRGGRRQGLNNPTLARYLPTQHNVLCRKKPTAELIYSHEDFALNREAPPSAGRTSFRFVQPRANTSVRVVLLLDTSEGMCGGGWMRLVHLGVSRFLQWRLPEGTSSVALVALAGDEARVLANLTRIEALSRRALRLLVPFDCGRRGVPLAQGFAAATQLLTSGGARSAGASVVLVTHAEQLQGANETLQLGPQLSAAGLVLSTVALGAYADAALELLAGRTGGLSFLIASSSDTHASLLDDALASAAQQLSGPDTREITPGRWTLQLSPAGGASQLSSPVTLAVTSRPRAHEAPPVRLWARPSAPWVVYPAVASLHARLSKGPDVVLDASVWASVGRPRGRHVVITLHDDGLGADTTAGDGVYSAFFTDHSGPGRYRVAVRATDSEGSARVVTPHICHSSVTDLARKAVNRTAPAKSSYRLADLKLDAGSEQWAPENPQQDVVPSGHFERYFDAGSFQLVGYREHSAIGPGPVTDLLVEASLVRGSRWLLELSWTAMGAHMDAGAVDYVDLRCSRHASELEENFLKTVQIRDSDIIRGSLNPLAPRKRHQIVIQVPAQLFPRSRGSFTVFLAVRTQDGQGRPSAISNVARATHVDMRPVRLGGAVRQVARRAPALRWRGP
ncbi:calcium-activated chloride channel regulator 3A-1-like isoform X3 [Haemaphysalis longicornis]